LPLSRPDFGSAAVPAALLSAALLFGLFTLGDLPFLPWVPALIIPAAALTLLARIVCVDTVDLFPLNHAAYRNLVGRSDRIYLLLDARAQRIRYAGARAHEYFNGTVAGRRQNGSSWMEYFLPNDRETLAAALERIRAGEESLVNELRVNRPDGGTAWLSTRIEAIRGKTGRLRRIAVICQDVSAMRDSQLKLVQAREYEVEVGARIQQSLLLGKPEASYAGMQIGSFTLPSQKIDGDFVDFFLSRSSDETDFVLGDVMGKGVPAALLGAAARTELMKSRFRAGEKDSSRAPRLSTVLKEAETSLAGELQKLNSFVTLIYARISRTARLLQFIDCGHTSMIHYDSLGGHCWRLKGANMPLGFTGSQEFQEYSVGLAEGDIIFVYSDGITEAGNSEGELFGEERLMHLIRSSATLDTEALLQKIKMITFAYCAGSFSDDVTGIAIKITPEENQTPVRIRSATFPQRIGAVREMRDFIMREIKSGMGSKLAADDLYDIEIASGEAAANILRHQKNEPAEKLTVLLRVSPSWISVSIEYEGEDYNWQEIPNPDVASYQEGGYGLFLMSTAMDSVVLEHGEGDRRRLVMLKYLREQIHENPAD
jgi:serine phosphatase RsbU (regulator of sigma subunit)/anti-sigma regulatory factor (Ser/Thr protein kinase)